MRTELENWKNLMTSLGLAEHKETYEYLIKKYNEGHRAYHNIAHIEDCLQSLYEVDSDNHEIELALWFHDVIYNPYGSNNELKSAEVLKKFLTDKVNHGLFIDRVYDLIMITMHDRVPKTRDEELIIDIDISILGRSEQEYIAYTKAIRKEYSFIPFFYYKKKRKEVMSNFLKKERLFHTERFYERYEKQARINIAKEIKSLK